MGIRVVCLILTLPVAVLACGQGSGSPGGPVEPPPPTLNANIVTSGTVTFGLCTGPGGGCFYTQEYTNTGPGCANSVHGTIRAFHEETLLESDNWWLETTIVMRPGDSSLVEDCCFDQDTVRQRTQTVSETFWNNVPCS